MRTLPVKQSFWVKAVAAQQLYLLLSLKPWQKVQPRGSSWLSCENVSPNTKHSPQHNLFTADSLSESTSSVSCLSHSPPRVCHQMPGSSGTTQSMKKTIGHRGVETTTGETTYKKVSVVGGRAGFGCSRYLAAELKKSSKGIWRPKISWDIQLTSKNSESQPGKKKKKDTLAVFPCRRRHPRWKVPSSWESLTQLAAWAKKQSGMCSCRISWWWKASSSPGRFRKLRKLCEIMTFLSSQFRISRLWYLPLAPPLMFFREGSNLTPAHHYSDFRFKTYAPIAFRYFRELFGIRPDDYLVSTHALLSRLIL